MTLEKEILLYARKQEKIKHHFWHGKKLIELTRVSGFSSIWCQ